MLFVLRILLATFVLCTTFKCVIPTVFQFMGRLLILLIGNHFISSIFWKVIFFFSILQPSLAAPPVLTPDGEGSRSVGPVT